MDKIIDILTSQYSIFALGYLYGVFAADWITSRLVNRIWVILKSQSQGRVEEELREREFTRYPWQASLVGIAERFLYIASLQVDKGEFIAVWLTLKTIAQSRRWTRARAVPGRAIYNTFLIGNALSILFALAAFAGMQWALGAQWGKDYGFALGIPIALFILVLIQYRRLGRYETSASRDAEQPRDA